MPVSCDLPIDHKILPWTEERIVFMHVPRTGGTTLTALLAAAVGDDVVCPEKFNDLPLWPAGLLARYRIFAGHFDRVTIDVIPGARKKVITLLRDPRSRIISTYRFWRIHRRELAVRDNLTAVLAAIDLDFLSFLQEMPKIAIHDIDNMYARVFGGFVPISGEPDAVRQAPLEALGGGQHLLVEATRFLDQCAAVGVLEEFSRSVSVIFAALNLPAPKNEIAALLRTDDLNDPTMYEPAGEFEITSEAEAEIDKLTRYDRVIYQHAIKLLNKLSQEAIAQQS